MVTIYEFTAVIADTENVNPKGKAQLEHVQHCSPGGCELPRLSLYGKTRCYGIWQRSHRSHATRRSRDLTAVFSVSRIMRCEFNWGFAISLV